MGLMQKVAESPRKLRIEERWETPVEKLFYNWHWKENLKHKEIAKRVGMPRPTVTRWFKMLDIPSQPGTRFTKLNLLNVGPRKTPPAKPKIKKPHPWKVNSEFFNKWSADMTYVLGFFCADGYMFVNQRGSHYIAFNITDENLLTQIKNHLGTGHKLSLKRRGTDKWKPSWIIQIGSKKIFNKFLSLGITAKKAYRLKIPTMSNKYISDFIRGYFDGDGGVSSRYAYKNDRSQPTHILETTFTSCSRGMLQDIASRLQIMAGTTLKNPYFYGRAWRLKYSISDSRKIYKFMYTGEINLYLPRKRIIFENHMRA